MTVRIVPGEIAAKDTTARVVLPTVALPKFAPYERVAETIALPARRLPMHKHQASEVFTYVIEGSGTYEVAGSPIEPIGAGDARLLSAPSIASHAISPEKGHSIRYFAVVANLAANDAATVKVQSSRASESGPQADGTAVTRLVGPTGPLRSSAGLECDALRFVNDGTSFRRVGHGTIALCYALAGRAHIDNETIEGGEAAVIANAAGVAIQGEPGFRAMILRTPGTAGPAASPVLGARAPG